MKKEDIVQFFDTLAPQWDANLIRHDDVINNILDNAGVREGVDVLDVACGTGVLFPDYLARKVNSVTAVDISAEMVKLAREKFPQVEVICGDVETLELDRKFDCIMVYNAFPHFPDPSNLIKVLSGMLKPGGTLTVAHGASRAQIDGHHQGPASKVSVGLMHENKLEAIFSRHLVVTAKISNSRMYQVTGELRDAQDHDHDHDHDHGHGHSHSHGGHSHSHGPAGDFTPMEELLALMKYTVKHNEAHAAELEDLAWKLYDAGGCEVFAKVMAAVSDFEEGNCRLAEAMEDLQ